MLPNYPPLLIMPLTATAIKALQMKEQHNEQKRLYLECKNVEKALLRHAQDTLEVKYVVALGDNYTNLITTDIPGILNYLFCNFGKVTFKKVVQHKAESIVITCLPLDSIILLTKLFEDLNKLA